MTWIEATCPTCGTVECAPADFELGVSSNSTSAYYAFTCPSCGDRVQKHAEQRVVELLIAEGVTVTTWEVPAEALEMHDGPAISIDDVLDMHLLLETEDWFDRVAQRVAS